VRSRDRVVEVGLLITGSTAVLLAALAVPRAGIGWDAGMHTYGALDTRGVDPNGTLLQAYEQIYGNLEFYGVLVQWIADAIHLLLGGEAFLQPDALVTYQMQAAVTLALSTASTALVAVVIARVLKSRIAGIFVWSTTMSLPFVMGHSVVNAKDMPTAVGLLLVSAGVALLWKKQNIGNFSAATLLVALGVFITLGVRIGAWPLIGVILILSLSASTYFSLRSHGWRVLITQLGVPAAGVLLGLLGIYVLNPLARIDFLAWAADAFLVSRSYPWEGSIRTLGQDVISTDLPWWYVPSWLGAQLPVVMLVFVVIGTGYWLLQSARSVGSLVGHSGFRSSEGQSLALIPFAVQGLVLPAGMVLLNATLYDGIRHVAFMVPALIVLSAPLVVSTLSFKPTHLRHSSWVSYVAGIVVLLVPVSGLVGGFRWFPYMYAYVNPLAAWLDDQRAWEYDFWGTTVVEGTGRLRQLGVENVIVSPPIDVTGSGEVLGILLPRDVRSDEEYGLYVFNRWYAEVPDEGCREVFEIDRGGIVLGKGAICQGDSSLQELSRNVRVPESK